MRKAAPLLIILALALLIRVAAVWEFKKFPVFEHPQLDEMEYDGWAKEISEGIILRTYVPLHSPGYPFFLAFSHKFLPQPYLAGRLLQSLISTLNVLLIFLIARKIFGRPAALLSALLAAWFWPMVYFQTRLLPPTLNIFFLLLSVLLILQQEKHSPVWTFGSGLSLSLAGMFWPLVLSVFPGFLLWLGLSRGWKKAAVLIPAFLLGLLLALAPLAWQNYYAEQDLVVAQKNFGLNFYLGNNPDSPGIPYLRPAGGWDRLQARSVLEAGAEKPSAQNRYYLEQWQSWVESHPGSWLNLLTRKTKLLFDNRELIASFDPEFYRARMVSVRLCLIGSGLVIALGLLGLFSARTRSSGALLIALSLFGFGLALVLTLISSRYRLGFMALALVPAGYGIQELVDAPFSGSARRFFILLGFLVLSLAVSRAPWPRLPDQGPYEYVHLGQAYLEARDYPRAQENFFRALRFEVSESGGYLGLAKVEMDTDNLQQAQGMAETAIRLDPDWAHAHMVLAEILKLRGEMNAAIEQFQAAVSLRPQYLGAWIPLADALIQAGRLDEAEPALRRIAKLRRDSPRGLLLQAKLALARNRVPEGLKLLKKYLKMHPDDKMIQDLVKEIEQSAQNK